MTEEYKNKLDFHVIQLIGYGKYTTVYEVLSKFGRFRGKKFALKRHFLTEPPAVRRALQERAILVRLSEREPTSPFVTTLCYSFGTHISPSLICTLASPYNLFDLRTTTGVIKVKQSLFYMAEIISGLEFIHSMDIVHRDLQLKNILLSTTGHVQITDFDLAYDCSNTVNANCDEEEIIIGDYEFMAPEVATASHNTTKSDVWSLGCILTHLITHRFTFNRRKDKNALALAKSGKYTVPNLHNFSENLKDFFKKTLTVDHEMRPSIEEVKKLALFESTDWEKVVGLQLDPPINIADIKNSASHKFYISPSDVNLLNAAFDGNRPIVDEPITADSKYPKNFEKTLSVIAIDNIKMAEKNYDDNILSEMFRSYGYTNPLFLERPTKWRN